MRAVANNVTRCCGRESTVLDSRPTGYTRRRRRRCDKCDKRWSTYEVPMAANDMATRVRLANAIADIHDAGQKLSQATQSLAEVLAALEDVDEEDDL